MQLELKKGRERTTFAGSVQAVVVQTERATGDLASPSLSTVLSSAPSSEIGNET